MTNPGNASPNVQSALREQIVPLRTFSQQTTADNNSTQLTAQTTTLEAPVLGFTFGDTQSLIVIAKDPNQYGTIDALTKLNPSNLNYIGRQEKPLEALKTVLQKAGLNPDDFRLETMPTTELEKLSGNVVRKTVTLPPVNIDAGTLIVGPNNNNQEVTVTGIIPSPQNRTINNTSLPLGQRITDPSVLQKISASDPLARYILDMYKDEIIRANPQPTGFQVYTPGETTPSTEGRKPQTFDGLYPKK